VDEVDEADGRGGPDAMEAVPDGISLCSDMPNRDTRTLSMFIDWMFLPSKGGTADTRSHRFQPPFLGRNIQSMKSIQQIRGAIDFM
tara:strand:- start:159 stop:416 length:258 start_codon:yes stop_codon:yes gene_type:complete